MLAHLKRIYHKLVEAWRGSFIRRIPVFLFLSLILYPLIGLLCALSYLVRGDEDCFVVCTHHIRYQGCEGE